MSIEPAYKLNDKITYKGISGTVTKVYRYTEEELVEASEFPNLGWIQTHPFTYTITYDEPQSYESILLKRKYPNDDPSTWIKIRLTNTFDWVDFYEQEDVKFVDVENVKFV